MESQDEWRCAECRRLHHDLENVLNQLGTLHEETKQAEASQHAALARDLWLRIRDAIKQRTAILDEIDNHDRALHSASL